GTTCSRCASTTAPAHRCCAATTAGWLRCGRASHSRSRWATRWLAGRAYVNLGYSLYLLTRHDEVDEVLEEGLALPRPGSHRARVQHALHAGRNPAAARALR